MDKPSKMLVDATHPEETRVVVVKNGRVEEFDYESAARKPLRGNIYLAKVTRVEPSLQAAFVDYGGNRHGFLAFNEIHPDYYQIPVADRRALLEAEAEAEAEAERLADARAERGARRQRPAERGGDRDGADFDVEGSDPRHHDFDDSLVDTSLVDASLGDTSLGATSAHPDDPHPDERHPDRLRSDPRDDADRQGGAGQYHTVDHVEGPDTLEPDDRARTPTQPLATFDDDRVRSETAKPRFETDGDDRDRPSVVADHIEEVPETREAPEIVSAGDGDEGLDDDPLEEMPERPRRRARSYKIQEVMKRRQVILVQVVKEERGTKGAALTTYLSLAGRYTVLMPNTNRGGGISRKITQSQDRKRLKSIAQELDVPEGMGLIIRTAGASRTKQEVKRDYEYLLRLWESVRDLTLESVAPSLVYEEGNLIKRSIRDLYTKDIDEVVVAGDAAHREAHDFMRMLMPSHTKNVTLYQEPQALFARYGVERQLAQMFIPTVTLRSGGYIVINQTEALVAVDVNSGKSTREFSIEGTALNTNLEAAEEVARQVKLRDLAGLIVIDFIDMDEKRHNRAVERCMKDALANDRARIQVGYISHFGLLEMSRQRLRTGVLEGSTTQCPHCQGTGTIRSVESVALAVLRGVEDHLMRDARASIAVSATLECALYLLNHKRTYIAEVEGRYGVSIAVAANDKLHGANFTIDRTTAPLQQKLAGTPAAVSMEWGFDGTDGDTPEADDRDVERDVELDQFDDDVPVARSNGNYRDGRQGRDQRDDRGGRQRAPGRGRDRLDDDRLVSEDAGPRDEDDRLEGRGGNGDERTDEDSDGRRDGNQEGNRGRGRGRRRGRGRPELRDQPRDRGRDGGQRSAQTLVDNGAARDDLRADDAPFNAEVVDGAFDETQAREGRDDEAGRGRRRRRRGRRDTFDQRTPDDALSGSPDQGELPEAMDRDQPTYFSPSQERAEPTVDASSMAVYDAMTLARTMAGLPVRNNYKPRREPTERNPRTPRAPNAGRANDAGRDGGRNGRRHDSRPARFSAADSTATRPHDDLNGGAPFDAEPSATGITNVDHHNGLTDGAVAGDMPAGVMAAAATKAAMGARVDHHVEPVPVAPFQAAARAVVPPAVAVAPIVTTPVIAAPEPETPKAAPLLEPLVTSSAEPTQPAKRGWWGRR